jgi:MFS family permease
MSIAGLMMGCLLAGKFLPVGRRRALNLGNLINIVGSGICLYQSFVSIMIGKFLVGFAGGLIIVSSSIYNKETLPASTLSYMGTSVNFGIVLGLLVSTIVQNLALPQKDDADYYTTNAWIYPFIAPIVVSAVSMLSWLTAFRDESVEFSMEKKDDEAAKRLLCRVYDFDEPEMAEQVLEDLR